MSYPMCPGRADKVASPESHTGHPHFGELSGQLAAFYQEALFCLFTEDLQLCMMDCQSLFAQVLWSPEGART